ncbi:uroporphyrinogen-III decarboxylase [Sphaerochaeta pleomorpha str. Grapes]|uniref:Uroporphyrinogen-III decarboxylase n=1 Tax=Sphaerochaeta pleomorpha (strain ATCC BAA-1885 / DSM 22778 / Grapes) TaxID=158190 RepID=G8QTQ1_SPHPG|nr:uroporphyrinogen decarboxylase family protein [Sphaerochaeta pleomorpha]AEV28016.1 uroporphyrinogen-III decarboxylase [Sphaerochaeta pleomorpha str. Grapes]
MNKRERVLASIDGKDVDFVPASFSLHFPKAVAKGKPGVKAHLDFYRETEVDIMKIMNENLIPDVGDIKTPNDWKKIPSYSMKDAFLSDQVDFVKQILDKNPENTFTLGTIHGVCASSIHPIESRYGYIPTRELHVAHLRENPTPFLDACKRITDAMCLLTEQIIKAGVDGIYYAALGAEKHFMTDEEFAMAIAPFDKQILSVCKNNGGKNFLHMCKENLAMDRYASYGSLIDVANWGVYETDFPLSKGRELFPEATIMGGLANRTGALVGSSEEDLKSSVAKILNEFGKKKFILGADCTLPTEIPYQRIKQAVMATR